MNTLQQAQHDWVKHVLSLGKPVVEYSCSECHEPNFSLIPEHEGVYSTAVLCPHCKTIHYRETSWKGKVMIVTDTEFIPADKIKQEIRREA